MQTACVQSQTRPTNHLVTAKGNVSQMRHNVKINFGERIHVHTVIQQHACEIGRPDTCDDRIEILTGMSRTPL